MRKWVEDKVTRAVEWVWHFLPDRCEMDDCERHGVRGNENRIIMHGKPTLVCDDCHQRILWERQRARREHERR